MAHLVLGCFESFPTTENLLISDEAGRVPSDVGGLNVDAQPNSADMSYASLSPDVSNPGIIRDMGLREPTGDCRENQTCHGEPCRTRDGRNGFYICDEPLYSTECIEIPSGMSVPDPPNELCDGIDNDCDGVRDEDFTDLGNDCIVRGAEGIHYDGKVVCAPFVIDGEQTTCNCCLETEPPENCLPGAPICRVRTQCSGSEPVECEQVTIGGCDIRVMGSCVGGQRMCPTLPIGPEFCRCDEPAVPGRPTYLTCNEMMAHDAAERFCGDIVLATDPMRPTSSTVLNTETGVELKSFLRFRAQSSRAFDVWLAPKYQEAPDVENFRAWLSREFDEAVASVVRINANWLPVSPQCLVLESSRMTRINPTSCSQEQVAVVSCEFCTLPNQDLDGDGVSPCDGDCDDSNPLVNPNVSEECPDLIDNDCDGQVDEGTDDNECPCEVTRIDGRRFFFCEEPEIEWAEAQTYCRGLGMELAIFENESDWSQSLAFMDEIDLPTPVFIGLSRQEDGRWLWLNGQELPQEHPWWAGGSAGTRPGRECGCIDDSTIEPRDCEREEPFICSEAP